MNPLEEQLWNYIDGSLNEIQRKSIEEKIDTDISVKLRYEALLNLNRALGELELDEPSMSFTRKVMDGVALQPAPVSLKTKVDNRIIFGIAAFFVLFIFAIFGYILYNSTLNMPHLNNYLPVKLNFEAVLTPVFVYIFLGVDLVLGLIFIDYWFRKKINH